jgi:hypothetical protein
LRRPQRWTNETTINTKPFDDSVDRRRTRPAFGDRRMETALAQASFHRIESTIANEVVETHLNGGADAVVQALHGAAEPRRAKHPALGRLCGRQNPQTGGFLALT